MYEIWWQNAYILASKWENHANVEWYRTWKGSFGAKLDRGYISCYPRNIVLLENIFEAANMAMSLFWYISEKLKICNSARPMMDSFGESYTCSKSKEQVWKPSPAPERISGCNKLNSDAQCGYYVQLLLQWHGHPFQQKRFVTGIPSHIYHRISNIRRTEFEKLSVPRFVMQLYLPNSLILCAGSRVKMLLEQRRQAMLQLHLSDQEFYCLYRCVLY